MMEANNQLYIKIYNQKSFDLNLVGAREERAEK